MDNLDDEIEKTIEKALITKDLSTVTQLLNQGVPISAFKVPGKTDVLLEAIVNKKIIIFNNMLERGFDPIENEFLYLHHCVRTQEARYVTSLLEKIGHNKEYINKQEVATGDTALHVAANQVIDKNILIKLSKAGVSWNIQNNYGQTALHNLLRNYLLIDEELIDEIMDKKANFSIKDRIGISPIDIIKSFSYDHDWRNNKNSKYLLKQLMVHKDIIK